MDIFYDSIQEGVWFRELVEELTGSALYPFPPRNQCPSYLLELLSLDRPDIILVDHEQPILVLERTTEVPSGHNVGQRFGRLVAAAYKRIPAVYFGPYMAYKHGGDTQGPRYMNLRLFYALKAVARIENTAITTINWPVDDDCEIIQTSDKDNRIKKYLQLLLSSYHTVGLSKIGAILMASEFEEEQEAERVTFAQTKVSDVDQYDSPPPSVVIDSWKSIPELAARSPKNLSRGKVVFYNIGMRYIRSDPYAGSALLYAYLYCGGISNRNNDLVLYFPHISTDMWFEAAKNKARKDVRMYKIAADGILFNDGYLSSSDL